MDHFESPRFLFGQTKTEIDELEAIGHTSFQFWKQTRRIDTDPKTGNKTYKHKFIGELPDRARAIVFNAITNLRSGIDQCLIRAVVALTGVERDDLYFPLGCNGVADLRGRVGDKVPVELLPVLEGLQPYPTGGKDPGGNDFLCSFSKVSRRKHRIVCDVGVQFIGFRNGKVEAKEAISIPMPPPWDWENHEFTIGTVGPSGSLDYYMETIPCIGMRGAGEFTNRPAVKTLKSVLVEANNILSKIDEATTAILSARQ